MAKAKQPNASKAAEDTDRRSLPQPQSGTNNLKTANGGNATETNQRPPQKSATQPVESASSSFPDFGRDNVQDILAAEKLRAMKGAELNASEKGFADMLQKHNFQIFSLEPTISERKEMGIGGHAISSCSDSEDDDSNGDTRPEKTSDLRQPLEAKQEGKTPHLTESSRGSPPEPADDSAQTSTQPPLKREATQSKSSADAAKTQEAMQVDQSSQSRLPQREAPESAQVKDSSLRSSQGDSQATPPEASAQTQVSGARDKAQDSENKGAVRADSSASRDTESGKATKDAVGQARLESAIKPPDPNADRKAQWAAVKQQLQAVAGDFLSNNKASDFKDVPSESISKLQGGIIQGLARRAAAADKLAEEHLPYLYDALKALDDTRQTFLNLANIIVSKKADNLRPELAVLAMQLANMAQSLCMPKIEDNTKPPAVPDHRTNYFLSQAAFLLSLKDLHNIGLQHFQHQCKRLKMDDASVGEIAAQKARQRLNGKWLLLWKTSMWTYTLASSINFALKAIGQGPAFKPFKNIDSESVSSILLNAKEGDPSGLVQRQLQVLTHMQSSLAHARKTVAEAESHSAQDKQASILWKLVLANVARLTTKDYNQLGRRPAGASGAAGRNTSAPPSAQRQPADSRRPTTASERSKSVHPGPAPTSPVQRSRGHTAVPPKADKPHSNSHPTNPKRSSLPEAKETFATVADSDGTEKGLLESTATASDNLHRDAQPPAGTTESSKAADGINGTATVPGAENSPPEEFDCGPKTLDNLGQMQRLWEDSEPWDLAHRKLDGSVELTERRKVLHMLTMDLEACVKKLSELLCSDNDADVPYGPVHIQPWPSLHYVTKDLVIPKKSSLNIGEAEAEVLDCLMEGYEKELRLAKIAADLQAKKEMEEREKQALRKEVGLAVDTEVVHAKCTAMRGLDGASCHHEAQHGNIQGVEKYVFLQCTDECKMHFHQDCWKTVEKLHRSKDPEWKLKRGVSCVTEGCPGKLSFCALQTGPSNSPDIVQIMIHREEKQLAVPELKQRHIKAKKRDKAHKGHEGKKANKETAEVQPEVKAEVPAKEFIPNQRFPKYERNGKYIFKSGRTQVEEAPERADQSAAQTEQADPEAVQKAKPKPQLPTPPKPDIDITKLSLDALKLVEKDESAVSPKKEEPVKKSKPLKEKQYIQPDVIIEEEYEYGDTEDHERIPMERPRVQRISNFFEELEKNEPAFGGRTQPRISSPEKLDAYRGEGFFGEIGERMLSARDNTQHNVEYPRVDEAAIVSQDPAFFKFLKAVQDVVLGLKTADHRANLCLEQIDVDLLVEQAIIPERHLQDTLSEFGNIEKFTFFSVIGVVAVKFSSVEQAVLAHEAMNRSMMGAFEVQSSFLQFFPSDEIFIQRLGKDVWQKYHSQDIQLALRTAYRAEQKERDNAEEEIRKAKALQEEEAREKARQLAEQRAESARAAALSQNADRDWADPDARVSYAMNGLQGSYHGAQHDLGRTSAVSEPNPVQAGGDWDNVQQPESRQPGTWDLYKAQSRPLSEHEPRAAKASEWEKKPRLSSAGSTWNPGAEPWVPQTSRGASQSTSTAAPQTMPDKRLNAFAAEFVPSSFGSGTSLNSLYHSKEDILLSGELSRFKRCEVVGCDQDSIHLYLEDKKLFGVVPNQIVIGASDGITTALVLYQLDTCEIFGLWKVDGKEGYGQDQVIRVTLVEEFEPVPETEWCLLLDRDEYESQYNYPQCLDFAKTQELLKTMVRAKRKKQKHQEEEKKRQAAEKERQAQLKAQSKSNQEAEIARQRLEQQQEAFRKLAQAKADEEFARKLQEEMDRSPSPPPRPTLPPVDVSDEILARKLQEEEDGRFSMRAPRAADLQPSSFAQAVRQPRPISSAPKPTQPSSPGNNFSDFFPTAAQHVAPVYNGWGEPVQQSPPQAWPEYETVGVPEDDDWCADPVGWDQQPNNIQEPSNDRSLPNRDQDWAFDDYSNERLNTETEALHIPSNTSGEHELNANRADQLSDSPEEYNEFLAMLGIEKPV